jgi:protease IV
MRKFAIGCLVLVLALVLMLVLGIASLISGGMDKADVAANQLPPLSHKMIAPGKAESQDKIARIELEGIISSMKESDSPFSSGLSGVEGIKRELAEAAADENVKAIVLRINSPGGEVTASDVIYHAVKIAAEKKPVVIHMDSLAASGGYYISCAGTQVIANPTTLTGSIGVIISQLNYYDLFQKIGLSQQAFTSGAFKDSLSGARPMREDEKVYIQTLVNESYERFLGIVAEARKLPKEQLRTTVADGRILTGQQALAAKLIDKLGYIEDAYALAKELGKAPNAAVVSYERPRSFIENLLNATGPSSQSAPKIHVDLHSSMLPRLQPGLPYFLPASYLR